MRRTLAIALLSFAPACFHVDLPPVSPNAPPQQRVAEYQQLRPVAENKEVEVVATRNSVSVTENDQLVLGNGTTVTHADDLLPVIAAGSPAAYAAQRSGEARSHKWTAALLGTAAMVVGTGMLVYGASPDPNAPIGMVGPRDSNLVTTGVLIAVIGGLVGGGAAWYYGHVERTERRAAFATYDDALRQQLALCVNGLQLVACEQQNAAPAAPTTVPLAPPASMPPAPQ